MSETVLDVRGLTVHRGGQEVLHSVSLEVGRKQAVAVLGPNGAGKTTLLRTISGLHSPKEGGIRILGLLSNYEPRTIVKRGLIHVPQGREVFPKMTVEENLEMGGYTAPRAVLRRRMTQVYSILPKLESLRQRRAGLLSGGEQQMLAIGRALVAQPSILTLDEPSMGLAPLIVDEVGNIIEMIRESGTTVLLVEQQLGLALRTCDYIYVLVNGEIAEHGPAARFRDNSALAEAYLSGNTTSALADAPADNACAEIETSAGRKPRARR